MDPKPKPWGIYAPGCWRGTDVTSENGCGERQVNSTIHPDAKEDVGLRNKLTNWDNRRTRFLLRVVWGDYLKQASPWGMCRIRIIAEGTLARRCGIEMPFLERRSCFLGMDCVYRGAAVVELGAAVEI